MALFVLGDPHLSLGASKPMDIFPGWNDYVDRLEKNWRKLITPQDTIVLAGDISWAMRLTDTRKDFAFLQQLPGQKIIMKGNHDYWWSTANKMNAYLKAEGFDTLHILHNNSYSVEGYAICGTRGWLFDVGEPHDEKVMNREIGRLRMSLQAAEPGLEKLVFLHYPPVYTGTSAPEIVATLKEYSIRTCYYGHLHGNAIRYAVQSGPMLIENGVINWRLKPSASSRKLRNGVGIDKQGRVVFMLSDRETNFYDFACYAQSKLGVRQMLYLDGTLSKMYRKGGSVPWQYHPFVTMITVERK